MLGEREDMSQAFGSSPTIAMSAVSEGRGGGSLARALVRGEARAVASFAGQGERWWVELAAMAESEPWLTGWLALAERVLTQFARTREAAVSGLYEVGTGLGRWLRGELPAESYLSSAPISLPMILLTQAARWQQALARGLGAGEQGLAAATGYSQGLAAAALVSERDNRRQIQPERLEAYLRFMVALGFEGARATQALLGDRAPGEALMAAVVGPDRATLDAVIGRVNKALGQPHAVVLALANDRKRHVLSGAPEALAEVRRQLEARAKAEQDARAKGVHGGRVLQVAWEPIAASLPFHHPALMDAAERAAARCADLAPGALACPVYDAATAAPLAGETWRALASSILARPGAWQHTLLTLVRAEAPGVLIDAGPGEGIGGLTAGALRGTGVEVFRLALEAEREELFAPGWTAALRDGAVPRYDSFAPRLARLPDGRVVADNTYTRATGMPPVILPGMTPTTVDVPIVAAAANAGYWSELAGGGQVSERIFRERMNELKETLAPGAEVVFNALLLDSYLWNLHLGKDRLVQKARAEGAPICGVVVSAGIPEVDAAVALLDDLASLGMTMNAFKPGTKAQIEQVVKIAKAAPRHVIYIHVEGGKAGGHHSWEDLEDLLLETYAQVRAAKNLVLCVGGGVATEARAVELLTGAWSERHGQLRMPVDAVFLGTLAMACREATASPAVKQALVAAQGSQAWVGRGVVEGGMTSGRSQLDADIHYLENRAARCGRLLDEVAGDAAKVAARRDEIIAALAGTAKPYFGDFAEISWREILERMTTLMALGKPGPNARYEDGPWLDVTWRMRVFDVARRAEARAAGARGIDGEVASALAEPEALDEPRAALEALLMRWPELATLRPHPADLDWFLKQVCARPGKPVPFVPVIDQDVRRYFKSDSLWQAQDPRYDADAVLVIPGPEAVSGIGAADEPVAELLGRFERALVAHLQRDLAPAEVDALVRQDAVAAAPQGVVASAVGEALWLRVEDPELAAGWLTWVGERYVGALAELVSSTSVYSGTECIDNVVTRLVLADRGAVLKLTPSAPGSRRLARMDYSPGADPATRVVLTDRGASVHMALTVEPGEDRAPDFELELGVTASAGGRGYHLAFHLPPGDFEQAVAGMYDRVLFEDPPSPVGLFEVATDDLEVDAEHIEAYRRIARQRLGGHVPTCQVFSLAWPAIYRTLACEELVAGLLRLVHLDNTVEHLAPLGPGRVAVEARVTRLVDHVDHRLVHVAAELSQRGVVCARLEAGFHIRGRFSGTGHSLRAHERLVASLELGSAADLEVLAASPFVQGTTALTAPLRLELEAFVSEERPRHGLPVFSAHGVLTHGGEVVARVDGRLKEALAEHPLRALAAVLAPTEGPRPTPKKVLARELTTAPATMHAFAEVGGDKNPIHRSVLASRLAGLGDPIAHGMWTAARLHALVVDEVARDPGRVSRSKVSFSAPVLPGERLELTVVREAVEAGAMIVHAHAKAVRGEDATLVATLEAKLAPERTAVVFPGQGIQQQGMGMAALSRSPAARKVWERADQWAKRALGFSILRVVRENPRELSVRAREGASELIQLQHPEGVIHLTQLTQVAMAVLAYAQVAELREAGVWPESAMLCGHSVGEYNAISAAAGVLPLESVLAIVYQRGCVMHGLVPRDAAGRSAYAMGVIRPHYAKLDHAGAEALVREVAEKTGGFLEIVNFNVKGRQYSVTGELAALSALERALADRQRALATPGAEPQKPAWVTVPGIDVPFHSRALRDGVPDFRAALDRHLPSADAVDPAALVDRYIPNLVARPFALTADFVATVRDHVHGASRAALDAVLADFPAALARPRELTRLLLVELLAWQFASPVRWIETQDLLFSRGPSAVTRLLEVGVGTAPTLANMARQTLAARPGAVKVLNIEAERAEVFAEDADAPAPAVTKPTPAPKAEVAQTPEVAQAAQAATVEVKAVSVRPADAPLSHGEALISILALQAKVRPDQIGPADTIDGLFDGVSSRRNQVLMDIGAEFDSGSIDRAHELPIKDLVDELTKRAPAYQAPGAYLGKAWDEAFKKALGKAGVTPRDLLAPLDEGYGFGPGLVGAAVDTLALALRAGPSARGGELQTAAPITSKDALPALIDQAVKSLGQRRGVTFGRLASEANTGGGVVDAKAVQALRDELLGKDGPLARAARELFPGVVAKLEEVRQDDERLAALTAELGEDFLALVTPRFDSQRHVAFASSWASAHATLTGAIFDRLNDRIDDAALSATLTRLAPHASDPRLAASARWFAGRAPEPVRAALLAFTTATPAVTLASPALSMTVESAEVRALIDAARPDFAGLTALVTGASPASIAIDIVARLLRGGARVVVTTSTLDRKRVAFYRELHHREAAPGAELHVVPFNQCSLQDTDALVDWLFRAETEQAGATTRVLKPAMRPDLVVPFAALKDLGTADQLGAAAEATLRAMVIGTERLVAAIARRMATEESKTHVLLPLSPNHGAFGGDGAYAESKAALEVMVAKWRSEQHAWARGATVIGARIGWVRGTGLMAQNDGVADGLERATGIRTYSNEEMGALLTALMAAPARQRAAESSFIADLSGGFGKVADLKAAVDGVRAELAAKEAHHKRRHALVGALEERLRPAKRLARTTVEALPDWPLAPAPEADLALPWPKVEARPEDLVVIVGFGEVSPGGSARTRFELEVGDRLSAPAVLELAWMCGLVRYEGSARGGTWVDVQTKEAVPEGQIQARYEATVRARLGVRPIEPATAGFDAERAPVLEKIYLDRDLTFRVGSEAEARAFATSDPAHTSVSRDGEAWVVTRKKGAEIRVPREVKLARRAGGQLPSGFDLARYGFPAEMIANVDRLALMNLMATVESFVAAGTTPEELLAWVHPARVGTTQGSGMGGMRSLHRLYVDHVLGRERQSDILQETLINVVFAYATSAYVGSYGPMTHPVAACATAAVSLEDACDKILLGKADVVMAGGWDDISEEGYIGFGDMNATAETDKMLAMGLEPDQFSRANDRRRRGFVEAQGGGSLLLARGDVARDMGLPVYGVLAFAGSFGDGINRSIPAPGLGALAAALGGARSPLARALARLGLTADDLAVVSKHDTSTNANDPNESNIHQTLQEALGRTPGNPLLVHSQKTVLGHAKGGAAAWQAIALCQMLSSGVVPGNRNLESVDPGHRAHHHLLYTHRNLRPGRAYPLRAGLLTSLGFGHVSALVAIAHPMAFAMSLSESDRRAWHIRQAERQQRAKALWGRILLGREKLYDKRGERRFASPDGTDAQRQEETTLLLDPAYRLVGASFGKVDA